jgi:hypothetical protein
MHIDWRALAVASALLLQSCGGGGGDGTRTGSGGGASAPPAGNTPPAGAPPPAATPTFTSGFIQFVGWPKATVAADVDNDGRVDIVVLTTDHFASGVPEAKGIDIFYQRDTDAVASAATAAITEHAQSLAACDIDGDGKKEILVGYNGAELRVHSLAPNGTPLPPTTLLGVSAFTVECLDLDGDRNADVVTTGKAGFDVQVLMQRNGRLTELETFPSDSPSSAPFETLRFKAVGDINGDGKPDLIFHGFDRARTRGVLVAYLQIDNGRFVPLNAQKPVPAVLDFPLEAGSNNFGVSSLAIVDLFANGMRDIVVASGLNRPFSHITIATFATNGQLVSSSSFPTSDIPVSLRVADVDGDGRNDIVVYHNGHGAVGVHYQNFNGSFRDEQRLFLAGPAFADQTLTDQAIVIGDFDSNGKLDIALGSQSALFFFFQD